EGEGEAHLSIFDLATRDAAFADHVEIDQRLVVPATASRVIVVGAWSTRDEWPVENGVVDTLAVPLGEVALFSAPGPTRDLRPLPDLVAPGEMVLAALSSDADPQSSVQSVFGDLPYEAVAPGRLYAGLRGTSVAAPFVTGTI